jgi:D-serine deaminase-like pyridoxal phosphate-dependent protein
MDVETPVVLVDLDRLKNNIMLIQEIADARGVRLRPHIKTHKCLEIARMQRDAGAAGITASKVDEALVFVRAGFHSLTLAYPLVADEKLDRLLKASGSENVDLRLIVDSLEGVASISRAAERHGMLIHVFLKVDVGLHRCGLKEGDPLLVKLAQEIEDYPLLSLAGILSHAGHIYGSKDSEEALCIAREEARIMMGVREQFENEGMRIGEVSVGSTPTVLASDRYEGITEIRPGNYVFMDRTPLRLKLIGAERIALSVMAMVVSANDEYFIVDAGSKVLSSDTGAHGIKGMEGYGLAYPVERFQDQDREMALVKLSEEHGFLARQDFDVPIGARVRIVPNHACVVANLADSYLIVEQDRVVDRWPVAALGKVR